MALEIHSRQIHESSQPGRRYVPAVGDDSKAITTSLRLHIICIVMVLCSACIFALTEHDDNARPFWFVFRIVVQTGLVVAGTVLFRRRLQAFHDSSMILLLLVMITCLTLLLEPIRRAVFNVGNSFELLVMQSQCNLMLALAVCGFRLTYQKLAALIAVFMAIFCCTISSARGVIPMTVVFTITAVVWLVAAWWEAVDRRLLDSERGRLGWSLLAVAAIPLLVLLFFGTVGSTTITTALRGFMPSSGGDGAYDPYSRGGVRDGDALVAGDKNIKTFGPLEDAPFVESDKPSLYDVFNDQYDAPARKVKNQQRAIALPPDLMKHIHEKMAEARQAGREFSLLRSEKKGDKKRLKDLETKALFYIAGRTPLHLKSEVYNIFDGTDWAPADPEVVPELQIKTTEDRHWLKLPQIGMGFEVFEGTETHSLKNANLAGNVIPSPAHPVGISIDKVGRADFYTVRTDSVIALQREALPSMTAINFVSRCVDRGPLFDSKAISSTPKFRINSVSDLTRYVPEGDDFDRIRARAEEVASPYPRGWQQIDAIERYLRENYTLNRDVRISDDFASALDNFLFSTREGPDYLFASSAAMMLRAIGYPSRYVTGFYARPDRYDETKRHTPVMAADVHTWCEVNVGANLWLTIEPTPGYHILQPPPGLLERIWTTIKAAAGWVWDNIVIVTLVILGIATIYRSRRSLQERLLTLRWKLRSGSEGRRRAIQLATLVDQRLRLAGLGRHAGTTLRRWSQTEPLENIRGDLVRVAELADLAAFAPEETQPFDTEELNRLAQQLNYRQMKQLSRQAQAKEGRNQVV